MSKYSFEWYLKEHCRYGWLSHLLTPETLKENYFDSYIQYCKEHGMEYESITEADKYLHR